MRLIGARNNGSRHGGGLDAAGDGTQRRLT